MIDVGVPKQPINSGSRGLRELKGLISNVNYEVFLLGVGAYFL